MWFYKAGWYHSLGVKYRHLGSDPSASLIPTHKASSSVCMRHTRLSTISNVNPSVSLIESQSNGRIRARSAGGRGLLRRTALVPHVKPQVEWFVLTMLWWRSLRYVTSVLITLHKDCSACYMTFFFFIWSLVNFLFDLCIFKSLSCWFYMWNVVIIGFCTLLFATKRDV